MRKAFPPVSIVMRSHNDGALIGRTLDMFRIQSVRPVEIICVEDHSSDDTAEVLRRFPEVKVLQPPVPYAPGRVLNFAARAAKGEILVFNNSDAIPLDEFYLENLIAPTAADENVGATFGNQLPRPDAELLVRKDNERAFGDGKIAATWKHFFSMAASATRRQTVLDFPFDETLRCAEDIDWSWRLRRRGRKIVYVPEAKVEHSHNYTASQLRRRFFDEGYDSVTTFGGAPGFFSTLRAFLMECLRDIPYLVRRRAFPTLFRSPLRRFRQKFGFYAGARRAWRERRQ